MSSNIVKPPSSRLPDTQKLRAFFRIGSLLQGEGGWISDPNWWVQSCERVAGADSTAIVIIPTKANSNEENVYSVALNPDGPLKHIKVGTRMIIKREWLNANGKAASQGTFVGKVVCPVPDLGDDTLAVHCTCARNELKDLRVIGRHIWNPDNSSSYYQQGWPAHFNKGNRPNCIFTPSGKPRFAPYPDKGLSRDSQVPVSPDLKSSTQACYWTLANICAYLAEHYGPDAAVQDAFPFLPRAPSWLVWDPNFAASIDQERQDNFNDGSGAGGQNVGRARNGREVRLEGMSILDALDTLLGMAGDYMTDLVPIFDENGDGDFKAQLTAVPMLYNDDKNAIDLPVGEFGATLQDRAVLSGGQIQLNGVSYLSRLSASSALVLIERLMESPGQLGWSHDDDRFTAWRRAIIDLGNDDQAFEEACQQYNDVAQFIRTEPGYNFQAGTDQEDMPLAAISRQPWPTLLSMLGNGLDYAGLRYLIWIEVKVGSTWTLATRFNGLESYDDGNIMVPQLRDLSANVRSWYAVSGNDYPPFDVAADGGANLAMREIRATLDIPCDHRLTVAIKLAADLMSGPNAPESIGASPDADFIDPEHSRAGHMDLSDLFALWLRIDSWPEPKSISGVTAAEDFETAAKSALGFRNDTEFMQSVLRRELKRAGRLQKGGAPRFDGWLVGSLAPGMQVKNLAPVGGGAPFPLRACIRGLRWSTDPGGEDGREPSVCTEVLFG